MKTMDLKELESKKGKIRAAINILKLLAHPIRLSILCNLMYHGEMNVTQLVDAEKGRTSQSQVSQFLGKMRQEGLVSFRKESQAVFYRISSLEAQKIIRTLFEIYCNKAPAELL